MMNWNDKAQEIADAIMEKMEDGIVNSYTRDDVMEGLRAAALDGIKYECSCWVLKTR